MQPVLPGPRFGLIIRHYEDLPLYRVQAENDEERALMQEATGNAYPPEIVILAIGETQDAWFSIGTLSSLKRKPVPQERYPAIAKLLLAIRDGKTNVPLWQKGIAEGKAYLSQVLERLNPNLDEQDRVPVNRVSIEEVYNFARQQLWLFDKPSAHQQFYAKLFTLLANYYETHPDGLQQPDIWFGTRLNFDLHKHLMDLEQYPPQPDPVWINPLLRLNALLQGLDAKDEHGAWLQRRIKETAERELPPAKPD